MDPTTATRDEFMDAVASVTTNARKIGDMADAARVLGLESLSAELRLIAVSLRIDIDDLLSVRAKAAGR